MDELDTDGISDDEDRDGLSSASSSSRQDYCVMAQRASAFGIMFLCASADNVDAAELSMLCSMASADCSGGAAVAGGG